ncbi:hypothetical protein EV424DRAFT_1531502 [Suillus variegatus]|nr:hypothetical protein EV424DRAFT_1531502 [Suillus variegatus]
MWSTTSLFPSFPSPTIFPQTIFFNNSYSLALQLEVGVDLGVYVGAGTGAEVLLFVLLPIFAFFDPFL